LYQYKGILGITAGCSHSTVMSSATDFLKGTLDLMVLKTLSWAPAHGYAIARWIERCTDDALRIEEGSLYPALYRLEEKRLVASDWGTTELGRRAKIYRITPAGRRHLREAHENWGRFADALSKVLTTRPQPA
jgi:PadR family transcriptional regulator, regulatory protein PadR